MKHYFFGLVLFLLTNTSFAIPVPANIANVANGTYKSSIAAAKGVDSAVVSAFNSAKAAGASQAVATQAAVNAAASAQIAEKIALAALSNSTGISVANLSALINVQAGIATITPVAIGGTAAAGVTGAVVVKTNSDNNNNSVNISSANTSNTSSSDL